MCRVNAVVLDKTGTLTEGHPQVVDEQLYPDFEQFAPVLLAAETRSDTRWPWLWPIRCGNGAIARPTIWPTLRASRGAG